MSLRVFHNTSIPAPGQSWHLCPAETHHLVRVRRARPGDRIEVLDGKGHRAIAEFLSSEGARARLTTIEVRSSPACLPRVHLHLALAKAKSFELAIQKAAEFAVASIVPVRTAHCEVELAGDRARAKVEKWRAITIESLKQCGNPWLPAVEAPVAFDAKMRQEPFASRLRIIAALHADAQPLSTLLNTHQPTEVEIFVGPEGDFSAAEYQTAFAAGCHPVTLASTVLRVETATIAALALIAQHSLERFQSTRC